MHMKALFFFILCSLSVLSNCQDPDPGQTQLISQVPGYPDGSPRIFAGYLQTKSSDFHLHYVLVQGSAGQKNNLPLTIWFNGGPGCSSKIGFIHQIGPYVLPEATPYSDGLQLTQNKFSWHKISNLLFIDSPMGTGYNLAPNNSYIYNDQNTADDVMSSLLYFFSSKFPSYKDKKVYLAGEGYAGKYIPDLVLRIQAYNAQGDYKINLNGIMVGNGVMDFSQGSLQKSQIQYIFSRNFVDPTLDNYWRTSCSSDPSSAGCAFFFNRYDNLLAKTNLQNIYGSCASQSNKLLQLSNKRSRKIQFQQLFAKCQYYSGINSYFKIGAKSFNSNKTDFLACNQTIFSNYEINQAGSMNEYGRILSQIPNLNIYFYNGDWDSTVPFFNTLQNLQKLGMRQNGTKTPLFDEKQQQHVGFSRTFLQANRKITFWTIKGSGLRVPIAKGETVYKLYRTMLGK